MKAAWETRRLSPCTGDLNPLLVGNHGAQLPHHSPIWRLFPTCCYTCHAGVVPGAVPNGAPLAVCSQAASSTSVSLIGTSTPSGKRAANTSSPFIASMNFRRVPM